ncbi:tetratricopeptide repeat protein [Vitiosangium sp. GDMCC 1.1324]|uniref:serine/threonine-protein kinase n=1 Tax=Vitiosangium sp. (strain GDMCC 1.1324) TaxID=2138576 RepID=UPI000D39C74F|nr:tetratricopeptide repeat protein [Vitiosangium sp. GDMCC 1.1324]PTL79045.1 serine/threonine protein kinase [Vitiosangium sp. GDMCC 1.1324]
MREPRSRGRGRGSHEPAPDTGRSTRIVDPDDLPPISQVGRYLLLKRLGEGGMGVVYAAYDPDLDRKVALKLLHPDEDPMAAETARARLLREAQAMARVSHPNVIPIFDVGLWGAQVFLAMELSDGGTLSAWLEEEHSWREVLERFLDAGRGLMAAHEAGLVHRDFKPSNVLVSRAGRVYVTDFGLARQVGASPEEEPLSEEAQQLLPPERRMLETTITQDGVVMGTPNYMSPEQFRGGELDARSDQFSFCAALYWGLYRKRAFESAKLRAFAITQSRKQARRTAPLEPEQKDGPGDIILEPPKDKKVPAWVRQALMRGLALEPGARFPSMKALLEALSQEQRRVKRRRWVVAASTAAAGLAVVGGALYQQSQVCAGARELMAEVWGPAARGKLEAAFLATKKPFAQETASRVTQVLEDYAAGWTRQRTEACEATRVQGVQTDELLSRRVVCLERRRKDLAAAVELMAEANGTVVEKALDTALALPSLQDCADVESLSEQQRLPSDPAKRADIERLEGRLAEVKVMVDAGLYKAAMEKARQLEAPVLATGHLPLMAELRQHLGWLQEQLGESAEASRLLSQAVYDAEAGRADKLKVSIFNKLLFVEDGQKHFGQAEGWSGLAQATLQRLGGEPALEAEVLVNRANLAISQEHYPEARTLLEQARALQAKALPPGHPKRARTTFLLGRVLLDMGERPLAVEMLEEALKQTEASVGALHPDMARRHGLLAGLLREMGQPERALEHARATAHIREVTFGEDSPQLAEAQDEVGMCLLALKRYDEALKVYQKALEAKRQALPPDDEQLQYSYDGVGQALLGLGRARESIEPLRQAVSFASVPPEVLADSGFALARALWESGQQPEARTEAATARERFTQAGLSPRVAEVDSWLQSLPKEPEHRTARPPRPTRRPAHR